MSIDFNSDDFENYSLKQLVALRSAIRAEKRERTKRYIKPAYDQYVKPLREKYINPLKREHLAELNAILNKLRIYIPREKDRSVFINIDGKKIGPMTRHELNGLITEIDILEEDNIESI